jgi:hypothetical protein
VNESGPAGLELGEQPRITAPSGRAPPAVSPRRLAVDVALDDDLRQGVLTGGLRAAKTLSIWFLPRPVFSARAARISPLLAGLGLAAFGAAFWAMVVIDLPGKGGSPIGSPGPRLFGGPDSPWTRNDHRRTGLIT